MVPVMNDMNFMIKGVTSFRLFGQELWITTTTIGLTIVTLVLLSLAWAANRWIVNAGEVPDGFLNMLELAVEKLDGMVRGTMGHHAARFLNYIGTIFLFILFCNIGGLFGLRTPTADLGVTLMLGIVTFIVVQYQGIKNHGFGHVKALFQPFPILFPINLIGEITNPLSQALRLFGNMMSGVVIVGLWYGMMPFLAKLGIPSFLHVYTDLFSGCIQTYVFCMLTMVYVNDKIN